MSEKAPPGATQESRPGAAPTSAAVPAAAERELADLRLLFRVVNLMHASMDPARIARITLTAMTAGTALGMNRAAVFLLDPETSFLRGYMAVGPSTREEAEEIWARLPRESLSLEEWVDRALGADNAAADLALFERVGALRLPVSELSGGPLALALDGEAVCFGDETRLPHALRSIFDGPGGMILPLRSTDRVLGLVVADAFSTSLEAMSPRLALAADVAHQAGLAMNNAQQLSEVRVRAAELATLHELGKKFLGSSDLALDLRLLARCASEAASARSSVIWLAPEGKSTLQLEACWNQGDARPSPELEVALVEVAVRCLKARQPLLVRDVLAPDAPRGLKEAASLVCVPLVAGGRGIGAMAVFDRMVRSSLEIPAFDGQDMQ